VVGRPDANFVAKIQHEFTERAPLWLKKPASSLYFGGGTPSLLEPAEINKLINFFMSNQALSTNSEITLEANPEDIDINYVEALKDTGITRISLGTQSFDNTILKKLGRVHSAEQAFAALDLLQKNNFSNISVDLITGVPGENFAHILEHLDKLYSYAIKHISSYLLTIEENTSFARRIKIGRLSSPQEDDQVQIYRLVQDKLSSLGYVQYDISSFAQENYKSRHNQIYWAKGSYIGLGPGAHSLRLLADGGLERAHNTSLLADYLALDTNKFNYDRLSNHEALSESLAFGLRNMYEGINPEALARRHRSSLPPGWTQIIEKFYELNWLEQLPADHIRISAYGALFADAIMREIVCA
jgi:oxygen-independent coproporphyrinogen-3 oxidase